MSNVSDFVKVSVIVPVYNAESYLRQCLDSITAQTLRDIEIICVDDASDDASLKILREYAEKDDRIRVIEQEHAGAGAARNRGLDAATGEYLSFLDADDFFEPQMLETAYVSASQCSADITVFQSDFFNHAENRFEPCEYSLKLSMLPEQNPFSAADISDRIFNIGCGWAWDKLFKREFVKENGVRFQEIRTSNDMFFVFALYTKAARIRTVRTCLAHRRIHASGTLSTTREKSWQDFYLALMALKERLISDGTYDTFRHSFVNWSLNFTLWHLDTLESRVKKQLKQKCRTEYFEKLDILGNDPDYFLDRREYERAMEIYNAPPAKVSVIMPVYNAERYLRQSLDSILSQTLREIELICVDDGSTDASAAILREYAAHDGRVTLLFKDHTSAGDSRNIGLTYAEGEYLSFLDADDFFEPQMLERVYQTAKEAEADVCMFRCNQYHDREKTFRDCPWTLKMEEMPSFQPFSAFDCADNIFTMTSCTAWDKLFRRDFILKNSIRFQDVYTCNDMLFTFSAYAAAEKMVPLDEVLAHQRIAQERTLPANIEYLWHNFHDALFALKNFLLERNLYAPFKKSFVNWAADFCLFNLHHFSDYFRDLIRQSLRQRFFADLDIQDFPEADFHNHGFYEEIQEILVREPDSQESETPKVSIIVPTYNVEPYLRVCLDSVINQTLREIEIIIVNDGSTDASPAIIQSYAAADPRIVVLDGPNGGYGHAMNRGLNQAKGEYIGIVEPDDFVDVHMFERLYQTAEEHQADVVKADFYRFTHDARGNLRLNYISVAQSDENYGQIVNPAENKGVFRYVMNTWCGVYRRSFLEEYHIRHNETPGASFQDNGFWFFTMARASRVFFLHEAFYYNRRDNPNSSVASKAKVYCMNEEYALIREKLNQTPEILAEFLPQLNAKRFINYVFTYDRLAPEYRIEYAQVFRRELAEAEAAHEINWFLFRRDEYEDLQLLLYDPDEFRAKRALEISQGQAQSVSGKSGTNARSTNKIVHIVNITDNGYCMPTSVALTSLKANRHPDTIYKIHILLFGVNEANKKCLLSLNDENFTVDVREVNLEERFRDYTKRDKDLHVTATAILKLYLPSILSNTQKVLYIDGDVLIQGDLLELYNTDIGDFYAAAVKDIISDRNRRLLNSINYPHRYYFNSGVLLLNLGKMRRDHIQEKLLHYRLHGQNHFMDQDALNVVLGKNVLFLSWRYNFLNKFYSWWGAERLSAFYEESVPETERKAFQKAVILHMGSHEKPWKYEMGYLSSLYDRYYSLSPYARERLVRETLLPAAKKEGRDTPVSAPKGAPVQSEYDGVKFSVIVPVYNMADSVGKCLDSILSQNLDEIEVICVDDCSTDHSLSILQQYAAKDSRIRVIANDQNRYAGMCRNLGIEAARGKYLYFADADDFLLPGALESLWQSAETYGADIVRARTYAMNIVTGERESRPAYEMSRVPESKLNTPLAFRDNMRLFTEKVTVTPWAGCIRRSYVMEKALRFDDLFCANDRTFFMNSITHTNKIILSKAEILCHTVNHANSLVTQRPYHFQCVLDAYDNIARCIADQSEPVRAEIYMCNLRDMMFFFQSCQKEHLEQIYDPVRKFLQSHQADLELVKKHCQRYRDMPWYTTCAEILWMDREEYAWRRNGAYSDRVYLESQDVVNTRQKVKIRELINFDKIPLTPIKVSVVVPIYNVERYLPECLDSLLAQTLWEMEIICVNDGSPDHSMEILRRYARKDPRIKVIDKENAGYGHAMNLGMDMASGEYVGIVESDDYVLPEMYEELYKAACSYQADLVKSNFYRFVKKNDVEIPTLFKLSSDAKDYNRVIRPYSYLNCFRFPMNTWSGIYRMEFLRSWNIRHHESPGASFQDNGFWFQTFAKADRCVFLNRAFYMNRRDNPDSSVYDSGKIHCMIEEHNFIRRWIETQPLVKERYLSVFHEKMFRAYRFALAIAPRGERLPFLRTICEEFRKEENNGGLLRTSFSKMDWNTLCYIMRNPEDYYYSVWSKKIKVSVILAACNAENFLASCLESYLNQDLQEIEIICVNDGSTDDTLAILQRYAQADRRVRILNQEHLGLVRARNAGMDQASGEYLYFGDCTDTADPAMLRTAWEELSKQDADICVFDYCELDSVSHEKKPGEELIHQGQLPAKRPFDMKDLKGNPFLCFNGQIWNKLFRRNFLENAALRFSEESDQGEDMAFVFMALLETDRITAISKQLYNRRVNLPQSSVLAADSRWTCCYSALRRIREAMVRMGLYQNAKQEGYFINYALHVCLRYLSQLPHKQAGFLLRQLKNVWLEELNILDYGPEYYEDSFEYRQLKFLQEITDSDDSTAYFHFRFLSTDMETKDWRGGNKVVSVSSGESMTVSELVQKLKWNREQRGILESKLQNRDKS